MRAFPDAIDGGRGSFPERGRIIRGIVLTVIVAVALASAATVWAGFDAAREAVRRIGLGLFATGTCVASVAYLIRFARWELILRALGHRLPAGFGFRAYLAGLAMTCSPGKLGETVRSGLLLEQGVPVAHSLGAFLSDRAGDVIGVLALAAVGSAWLGGGGWASAGAMGLVAISIAVAAGVRHRGGLPSTSDPAQGWRARAMQLARPLEAWARIWTPGRVVMYAGVAFAAFGIQALVFAAYVDAVGGGISVALSVEIFATSMLFGAATLLPGGLGAMEAALVWRLEREGVPFAPALAAALAARVSTLWCGTLLGTAALSSFARRGSTEPVSTTGTRIP
jgi:glycosyltransferase 2 family protein